MDCNVCGAYANATVNGVHGGRVPVCDDHIGAEPDAVYRIPNHPHVLAANRAAIGQALAETIDREIMVHHPHPSTRVRGARASVPGAAREGATSLSSPDAAARHPVPSFTGNREAEAGATTAPESVGSREFGYNEMLALARERPFDVKPGHKMPRMETSAQGPERSIEMPLIHAHPHVVLELPEPPSENVYYRRAGTRTHLSHEGREYKLAVLEAAGARDAAIFPAGDVSVVIVWRRTLKSGDLDNRFKPLLDSLKSLVKRVPDPTAKGRVKSRRVVLKPGVYDDDGQVAQIWARRCDEHPSLGPGMVRVEVSAL